MNGFSPGPWVIAKSGVSVDAGMIRIRQEATGAHDDVRKANARLIAAAPELYRMCRAVLPLIRIPEIREEIEQTLNGIDGGAA